MKVDNIVAVNSMTVAAVATSTAAVVNDQLFPMSALSLDDVIQGKRKLTEKDIPAVSETIISVEKVAGNLKYKVLGRLFIDLGCKGEKESEDKKNGWIAKAVKYAKDNRKFDIGSSTIYGYIDTVESDGIYEKLLTDEGERNVYEALEFSHKKHLASLKTDAERLAAFEKAKNCSSHDLKKYLDEEKAKGSALTTAEKTKLCLKLIKAPNLLFSNESSAIIAPEAILAIPAEEKAELRAGVAAEEKKRNDRLSALAKKKVDLEKEVKELEAEIVST